MLRGDLDQLIESTPSLYVLRKRASYLLAFLEYIKCKAQKRKFVPPKLNALYFEEAQDQIVIFRNVCMGNPSVGSVRKRPKTSMI